MTDTTEAYRNLWEEFGRDKKDSYFGYKFNPIHRIGLTNFLREKEILRLVDVQPEDCVLDVGCASGQHVFMLAKVAHEGYGADIAQSFVDAANEYKADHKIENTHFVRATAEELPFEDKKFDVVICAEVLEHVFDKDIALKELLRVLKPGGRLIISVPNLNADATYWGRFLRSVGVRKFVPIEVFSSDELATHGDAHVREFDRRSMRAWLQTAGLHVEDIRTVSFIDGPRWFEYLLKIPLRIYPLQKLIIAIEDLLTRCHLSWGRHLVVKATKPL